ncbi:hypothetical protein [Devosia sp. Root635]|uniref:hypothetical protein n=1 Tax=Devosia sp. Root635 TaxID=1736575 RepID=UPI0006FD61DD|nr:hypothetical protein [Devosia sp. Root635]KRA44671.1 hypothetical protein ASD80_05885 [Devosia sp. Root635]
MRWIAATLYILGVLALLMALVGYFIISGAGVYVGQTTRPLSIFLGLIALAMIVMGLALRRVSK